MFSNKLDFELVIILARMVFQNVKSMADGGRSPFDFVCGNHRTWRRNDSLLWYKLIHDSAASRSPCGVSTPKLASRGESHSFT